MLRRYHRIDWLTHIDTELFDRWEEWFVDVEESHRHRLLKHRKRYDEVNEKVHG
mgnify:CR=1 FL=1